MKIKTIITLFLLFSTIPLFSQNEIKYQIALIEVQQNPEITESYQQAVKMYESYENNAKADAFANLPTSWFGSGFIIEGNNGRYFLVTNRHVTDFGERFSVKFTLENGIQMETDKVNVLYSPEYTDIALVELLDDSIPFSELALPISSISIQDGQNVWSAGFPAIMSTPVWQFSSGVITNNHVWLEDMPVSEESYLIQHSAPIDPGSSGGPLLIRNDNSYEVVGINTWKITGRSNTFFSIPSEILVEVLKDYASSSIKGSIEQNLMESVSRFLNDINNDNYNYQDSYIISDRLVAGYGFTVYENVRKSIIPSSAHELEKSFFLDSPLKTMQQTAYYKVFETLKDKEENWEISNIVVNQDSDNYSGKVEIYSLDEMYSLEFVFENGIWRLLYFPDLNNLHTPFHFAEESQDLPYQIYGSVLSLNLYIPIGFEPIVDYSLGYQYNFEIQKHFFMSLGLEFGRIEIPQSTFQSTEYAFRETFVAEGFNLSPYLGIGVLIPLDSNSSKNRYLGIEALSGYALLDFMEVPGYNGLERTTESLITTYPFYGLKASMEYSGKKRNKVGVGYSVGLFHYINLDMISYGNQYDFPDFFTLKLAGFIKFP